jgi:Zn-dependent protease
VLLWNLGLLQDDPVFFALLVGLTAVALLLAITVHEFAHALAASALGDSTPRRLGRLSLDPRRHLDTTGTLMLLIVGFGWGKPVPINPSMLRKGPRVGMALVAAAGPLSNIALAALVALPIHMGLLGWRSPVDYDPFAMHTARVILSDIVAYVFIYNVLLAAFNLIPVAPLDGFRVLTGILPRELAIPLARTEQYGFAILLGIVAFDWFTGAGVLWSLIGVAANGLGRLLVGSGL